MFKLEGLDIAILLDHNKDKEEKLYINENGFLQGELDGLCGVYSPINAYGYSRDESEEDLTEEFFGDIIRYLSKKRLLEEIILEGTNFKEVNMIMRDVAYKYMNYSVSWMGFPTPSIKMFWKNMQKHLTKEGNCIILGVAGRENHWSVVVKSTQRGMKLLDSSGWIYLRQRLCTTDIQNFDGKYLLYPAQTFFIHSNKGEK
jgi:hypothetical protein